MTSVAPVGTTFSIGQDVTGYSPHAALLANGNYIVIWENGNGTTFRAGGNQSIAGEIISASGAAVSSEFTILPAVGFNTDFENAIRTSVVNTSSGFCVAW